MPAMLPVASLVRRLAGPIARAVLPRVGVSRAVAPCAAATVALAVSCVSSPAMKSPLRERLANADTPAVEDATRACLDANGWTSDPVGSVSGGSNVVTAKNKDKVQTQVFVHPPDQKPRVTGGPDDDKFWSCLSAKLGTGADDNAGDKGGSGDKSDKTGKGDNGDKGADDDKSDKGGQ
jgi:hypothetical protein